MLVKFNDNNQTTTFIKSIVTATPLPVFDCVQDGDYIIQDCFYIYKSMVILCTVSGVLDRRLNDLEPGKAYVNKDYSRFTVIDNLTFGQYKQNISRKETCPNSYYDYTTHRLFGKYLRMIRSYHGIDLMPLYNVFDGTLLDDVHIDLSREYYLKLNKSSKTKVLWVPIKFNTDYTVFVDSKKPVIACPAFRNSCGMTEILKKPDFTAKTLFDSKYDESHYIYKDPKNISSNDVHTSYGNRFKPFILHNVQFNNPYYWEGVQCDTKELYERQNCLGLIIQLDNNNTSSVVVLEGNRVKETRIIFNSQFESWLDKQPKETSPYVDQRPVSKLRGTKFLMDALTQQEFNNLFRSRKQLTLMNDQSLYAFNDIIISYLLHHTITNMETIEGNIQRVQNLLPKSIHEYDDIWSDQLRIDAFNTFMSDFNIARFDCNGFIGADIERYLFETKDRLLM